MMLVEFNGYKLEIEKDDQHEFLISSKFAADGYGCSETTIRDHKKHHADELVEGKHFIIAKTKNNLPKVMWTKRGIVRLGFFIKSERAKKFRDWAEDYLNDAVKYSQGLLPEDDPCAEYKEIIMQQNRTIAKMERKIPNQMIGAPDMNDLLDLLGQFSRMSAEINIALDALHDRKKSIDTFLGSMQRRYERNTGIQEQCNRDGELKLYLQP